MSEKIALVTGGTGALGPCLVQALHQAGYGVRTLSRTPPQAGLLPNTVEVRTGSVTDPSTVRSAMRGIDEVIHLAALLHIANPPPTLREQYEQVNVAGTHTVVRAAIHSGVERFVFFSTIAVYGHANGQVLTEESPPQPVTFYAQTKLAAERIVLEARGTDGQPVGTVLRLGAVYGPRIKGNYLRLLQALERGRFVSIGDGCNRRTLIYDRDAARAAILALRHPSAVGKIFNVSDGEFHPMSEIVKAMCEALGRTPPRIALPIGPVRLVAGLLEDTAGRIGRHSMIGRATIDTYTEDVAVNSQRIQNQLGFVPQFDLRAGWGETVRAMRQDSAR